MTRKESELKLILEMLLDEMSQALAALRQQKARVPDLYDPAYVVAMDRDDRARNRWLVVLDDLRSRSTTVVKGKPATGKLE
jgi:hypothetical protein